MQSIEREAVEETIARNTNMAASSIHSESASSQLDQSRSHSHVSLFYAIHISNIFGQHKNNVTIPI